VQAEGDVIPFPEEGTARPADFAVFFAEEHRKVYKALFFKAVELAARADFYATAHDNDREYATHAHTYMGRRTVVHVAVAWECGTEA
jgi:hypothetical protein